MKPRHAAALALVGWYLMVPPTSSSRVLADAPIAAWQILEPFETLADCQHRKDGAAAVAESWHVQPEDNDRRIAALAMHLTQCIASDDPRLKSK